MAEKILKKKRFGGDFCCVPNCSNQRGKDARMDVKRSYYSFPKDSRRESLWVANIRRGRGWIPRIVSAWITSSAVCCVHMRSTVILTSTLNWHIMFG